MEYIYKYAFKLICKFSQSVSASNVARLDQMFAITRDGQFVLWGDRCYGDLWFLSGGIVQLNNLRLIFFWFLVKVPFKSACKVNPKSVSFIS